MLKKTHIKPHEYLRAAFAVGFDYKSAMLSAPGLIYDMVDTSAPKKQNAEDDE